MQYILYIFFPIEFCDIASEEIFSVQVGHCSQIKIGLNTSWTGSNVWVCNKSNSFCASCYFSELGYFVFFQCLLSYNMLRLSKTFLLFLFCFVGGGTIINIIPGD